MTKLCYLYTFIIALSNQFNITNVEWKWVLIPAIFGLIIDYMD